MIDLMDEKAVVPGLLYLVSEDAPSRAILDATAGGFARTYLHETEGVHLTGDDLSPEGVAAAWDRISDTAGQHLYSDGSGQVMKFVGKAAQAAGLKPG